MNNGIIKIDSGISGEKIAIFCGVHGNEKAGIFAVERALKELKIIKGSVTFVFANQEAIKKNVRQIEKNLNRCFNKDELPTTYESKRAIELMNILDDVDYLLDIHSSNNPNTEPFIITEKNGFDIVKNMNFRIIATGFDSIEPGATDGYMQKNNKIGICLECGFSGESEKNTDLAYDSIVQFLQYFGSIENISEKNNIKQKVLLVNDVQKVTDSSFRLTKSFADFEELKKGDKIAWDSSREYIIDRDRVILFGSPGKPVGAEAYILGEWI